MYPNQLYLSTAKVSILRSINIRDHCYQLLSYQDVKYQLVASTLDKQLRIRAICLALGSCLLINACPNITGADGLAFHGSSDAD